MGVHNLAEYVAYHQAKLREQSQPTPSPKPQLKRGVNPIHSSTSFRTSVVDGSKAHIVLLDCSVDVEQSRRILASKRLSFETTPGARSAAVAT